MIPLANLISVAVILTLAIILMWIVSLEMLNSKKIKIFLPFFMLSVWLCVSATLNFYQVHDQKIWSFFESFWGLLFLWILIIFIKNKNA